MDLHLSAPPPTNRRTDLDWLRVLLFAGLILYHVGLMFALWTPFEIRSDHRASWVEVALMSTHPWRMCLLFLISGVATRYAFDKLGSAKLAVNRSIQLLPPLLFGVALIVPLQGYIALTANLGYTKPYLTYVAELLGNSGFVSQSATRRLGQGAYLPLEEVLAEPPRLVIAAGDERMEHHPALRHLRGVRYASIQPNLLYCAGPTIPRLAARLAELRDQMS